MPTPTRKLAATAFLLAAAPLAFAAGYTAGDRPPTGRAECSIEIDQGAPADIAATPDFWTCSPPENEGDPASRRIWACHSRPVLRWEQGGLVLDVTRE